MQFSTLMSDNAIVRFHSETFLLTHQRYRLVIQHIRDFQSLYSRTLRVLQLFCERSETAGAGSYVEPLMFKQKKKTERATGTSISLPDWKAWFLAQTGLCRVIAYMFLKLHQGVVVRVRVDITSSSRFVLNFLSFLILKCGKHELPVRSFLLSYWVSLFHQRSECIPLTVFFIIYKFS